MLKLIILKNNLSKGLSSVEKAVGDNVNLPILKNISLKADDKIVLTSTNLELAIRHIISGKIIEPGEITIPFAVFNSIINNLNSERITLEQKDKQLNVNADNYEALVQGQGAKEFPIIPSVKNKNQSIKINVGLFKESLSQVIVASQFSDIRPEISGVFLSYQEKTLTLAATDSFRLAEKKTISERISSSFDKTQAIIPLKTAQDLLRVFCDQEDDLEIFIDPNQVFLKTSVQQMTSRLIEGSFPEYQTIIPKQIQSEMSLDRLELINAIKLTSSFSGRANDIAFKVGENKKFLEIYSADSALGENRYRVPIKLKGEKFSIAFNWRYLLDGLKIYKSEEVILGINASDRPVIVKSISEPFLIYVVMPIKS